MEYIYQFCSETLRKRKNKDYRTQLIYNGYFKNSPGHSSLSYLPAANMNVVALEHSTTGNKCATRAKGPVRKALCSRKPPEISWAHTCSWIYILSMDAFHHYNSLVAPTVTMWFTKPKIAIFWPSTEKVYWTLNMA